MSGTIKLRYLVFDLVHLVLDKFDRAEGLMLVDLLKFKHCALTHYPSQSGKVYCPNCRR